MSRADPVVPAPAAGAGPGFVRGVSLVGAVALVVGNMFGTSTYTLPATLAGATGPLALVAWVLTAAGYLFVAVVYARLATRHPRTGGPYVYARDAFGDLAAFQSVWAYWLSAVIGNVALVTSVVGYATGYSDALAGSSLLQFALAQLLLWGLFLLNVLGVRHSVHFQIAVVLLGAAAPLVLSFVALGSFEPANARPFAPHGWGSLAAGAALVVWAFSGFESATVPAEEVIAPERTIRRATLYGYGVTTVLFLVTAVALVGALPNDVIAGSPRPLALLAEKTLGRWAGWVIGAAAIVGGLATLNGWILMAGRIPVSAARDGLFFRVLGRLHPRYGTPHLALLLSTLITSSLLGLYFIHSLLGVFERIVLLSILTTLLPHLYSAAAELALARGKGARAVAGVAFGFVFYTIYGVGAEVVLWGFLCVLAGLPLYVWFARGARPA